MYGMRVAYGSIMRKNDSHTHPCPRAYLRRVMDHLFLRHTHEMSPKCSRKSNAPESTCPPNQRLHTFHSITHTSSLTSSAVDCAAGGVQMPMSAYAMNATSRVFGATLRAVSKPQHQPVCTLRRVELVHLRPAVDVVAELVVVCRVERKTAQQHTVDVSRVAEPLLGDGW